MSRFTYFSKHALKRIGQRTKLNYFAIADILDFGLGVDTGTEIVFDRKHWLFYSEPDDCCFVAVQDIVTGLVVTVLPIDYHQNLAWKIDSDLLITAKKKVTEFVPENPSTSTQRPSIFIAKVHYESDDGYRKTITLPMYKASQYNYDLFRVLRDGSFDSDVKRHCRLKNVDISKVTEVSIALGKHGEPLVIN